MSSFYKDSKLFSVIKHTYWNNLLFWLFHIIILNNVTPKEELIWNLRAFVGEKRLLIEALITNLSYRYN